MIEAADAVIIDVRTARTWWRSKHKIRLAIRENPSQVEEWAANYSKRQLLIFYCT
jgi:hypothetical protein